MRAFLLRALSDRADQAVSPWDDYAYRLARCVGFQVLCDGRVRGRVVSLLYDSRHDMPDGLLIRSGWLQGRRETVVRVEQVTVDPDEAVITVERLPETTSRVSAWLHHMADSLAGHGVAH